MKAIEIVHNLDKEISELERNFSKALNYIYALRAEKAAILTLANRGTEKDIKLLKEMFIIDNFDKQKEELLDVHNVEKDLQNYSYEWTKIRG